MTEKEKIFLTEPALHQQDFDPCGFQWIECHDSEQSTLAFRRHGRQADDTLVCLFNFTPVPRHNYRLGVPQSGHWAEILNSDGDLYGGSGMGNLGGAITTPVASHGQFQSLNLTLPPLAALVFKWDGDET